MTFENRYLGVCLVAICAFLRVICTELNARCDKFEQYFDTLRAESNRDSLDETILRSAILFSMSQTVPHTSSSEIEQLKERINSLEEKLLRVSNIYRYETLQNLLKESKWLEADKETVRLILAISGQTEIENLRPEEIGHIDCSELQVIDRLWLTCSDNRFGFSIQVKIYQELGGSEQTTI